EHAAGLTGPLQIDVLPGASLTARRRAEIIALCSRAYDEDFSSPFDEFAATTPVLASAGRRRVSHALWSERPAQRIDSFPQRSSRLCDSDGLCSVRSFVSLRVHPHPFVPIRVHSWTPKTAPRQLARNSRKT
ncbi:MAG: hypothetical protein NZM11_12385, partial [Anaerolineales bacterium]|nr:hypothetical protein [Anaerolineales bacterium]